MMKKIVISTLLGIAIVVTPSVYAASWGPWLFIGVNFDQKKGNTCKYKRVYVDNNGKPYEIQYRYYGSGVNCPAVL
ncbi:TPA: hypothetical protein SLN25_004914 [Serratia marcescens]|uniref:hypothetical protein n=1 Tax=Serratia marcescens TaxID=615 RepID=UPI0029CE839A|nr:hypothetical protein [Serratia marcescens]